MINSPHPELFYTKIRSIYSVFCSCQSRTIYFLVYNIVILVSSQNELMPNEGRHIQVAVKVIRMNLNSDIRNVKN